MQLKNTKNYMSEDLKVKLLVFLVFTFILSTLIAFNYYIEDQNPLSMKKLKQIVEQEILEHGKN